MKVIKIRRKFLSANSILSVKRIVEVINEPLIVVASGWAALRQMPDQYLKYGGIL